MANEKTYEITVQPREQQGKHSQKLRREAIIPAVVYGHNVSPESIQVPLKEFERLYHRAGTTTLVDLKLGEGAPRKVFIHDVQRNPISHTLTHVDFMVVNLQEEMHVAVPIALTGEAPAVKSEGGVLVQSLDHVEIRALPGNMPPFLEVDLSPLDEIDKAVHISDLKVPSNVTVLTPGDELIAKVSAVRATPEEVEAEAAAEEEAAEAAEAAAEAAGGEGEES